MGRGRQHSASYTSPLVGSRKKWNADVWELKAQSNESNNNRVIIIVQMKGGTGDETASAESVTCGTLGPSSPPAVLRTLCGPAPIHSILIQYLGWEPVYGDVRTYVQSG